MQNGLNPRSLWFFGVSPSHRNSASRSSRISVDPFSAGIIDHRDNDFISMAGIIPDLKIYIKSKYTDT